MTKPAAHKPLRRAARTLVGMAVVAGCWINPGKLYAFHNPARFFEDAIEGGGGGRFFTGSPADGYTCGECHIAAGSLPVSIRGLPTSGYVPGQTYKLTVAWPEQYENVAFNAEITDNAGRTLGLLADPDPDSLLPDDLCKEISSPAAQVGPTMDGRSLVISGACEQRQGTFEWTAPTGQSAGPAWFSGALVASDLNGDTAGDRVAVFSRIVPPQGGAATDTIHIEGLTGLCTIGPTHDERTAHPAARVLPLIVLLLWQRRRRKRLNCSRSRRR